jgi:hypothetical protein
VVGEARLLQLAAHAPSQDAGVGARVLAKHAHGAGGRRAQPLHALDGGGLAGAVRAQQTEDLAALDRKGDVVYGHHVMAVDLAQVIDGDDGRHAHSGVVE